MREERIDVAIKMVNLIARKKPEEMDRERIDALKTIKQKLHTLKDTWSNQLEQILLIMEWEIDDYDRDFESLIQIPSNAEVS